MITGFSPFSGSAGTAVTITGYNFGSTPTIKFNGVSASATVSGGTNIIATVPAGAGTGPITVATSSGGTDNSTNNFTVTAGSSPSLSLSVTTLPAFSTTWPSVSASQSYLLTGASLTGNITVTAPSNFELSLNNTNFASSQSLSPISGNLSNTVYVRLSASVLAGSASGVIAHSGGGASTQNLPVSGTVAKAMPIISAVPTASPISYGQALSNSVLSGGTADVPGSFAFTTPATIPASSGAHSVTFTPSDLTNYNSVNTNVTVTVNPASATITLGNLSQTYNGSARAVTVTTTPAGLGTSVTYNGSSSAPTNAGNYTVVATVTDPGYSASATNTLSIGKATPLITAVPTASAITVGQALSNSILSGGSASVAGAFDWTTPSTVPSTSGSYPATFTPMDAVNYNTTTTNVSVAVNALPASLTFAPATLGVFSATNGTASASQSYLLSGSGLTSNLSVMASGGFEISLTNNSGYVSSLNLTPSGGNLGTNTIYVRMASTNAPGVINGSLNHNGGGITNQTITLTGVVFVTNSSVPVILAKWTFESASISGSGTNSGNYRPEQGLQTNTAFASSSHQASSVFTNRVGNGSSNSFSCDNWKTNDYFQFAITSLGYRGLRLKFDHNGSSTGPLQFRIETSTDGSNFNVFTNYDIPRTNSSGANVWDWPSDKYVSNSNLNFDLSSLGQLGNKSNVFLRLVQRGTTSLNNSIVSSNGTSRVDNVEVTAAALDTNPPVLILSGNPTVNLTVGGVWSDPGVTALDAEDGNLAVSTVGAVNPGVLGAYPLSYTATDSAGNSSSTNRIVNVVLNGLNSVTADSDGNSIPDLVEYALGGSPTGNSPSILPSPTMVGTNLRISFLARTNDSSLIIHPVVSTNLVDSNSWGTNGIVKTAGVATNNGFELQTWETPAGSSARKFLKVNISR